MDLAGKMFFPISEGPSLVLVYPSREEKFPTEHCQHFTRRVLSTPTLLLVYVTPFPLKYLRAMFFIPLQAGSKELTRA